MQTCSVYPDHLSVLSRALLCYFSDNLSRNSCIKRRLNGNFFANCKVKQTTKRRETLELEESFTPTKVENTSLSRCNFAFLPPYTARVLSDVQDVFSARIALNILTCPFIILLNKLSRNSQRQKTTKESHSSIINPFIPKL